MKNQSQIAGVLTPVLARFGLELEAVEVIPAGKRRLVRVVVDGEGPAGRGPLLDDIAEASQACSAELDASDVGGNNAYTLEVSSRGVSRPLTLPRHWRRTLGRVVEVTTVGGDTIVGRIGSAGEDSVALDVAGKTVELALAEVTRALVQVELNRSSGPNSDPGESDGAADEETDEQGEEEA